MSKDERIEYLEGERIKIWSRITFLEELLEKKTSDYETEAKTSAEQAFEFKTISEQSKNTITEYLDEATVKLQQLRSSYLDFEQLYSSIKEHSISSKTNSEHITLLYDAITSKSVIVEKQIADIEKIFESKSQLDDKLAKLDEIFIRGDDYDSKLTALYKAITDRKKEIDDLYYQVIGYTEKDEAGDEVKIKGLKDELKEAYDSITAKLSDLEKEQTILKDTSIANYKSFSIEKEEMFSSSMGKWDKEYTKVLNKIETLLPNALTTGLSYAYSEKKQAEEKENITHLATFKYAIIGLVVVSLIPFLISVASIFQHESFETVIYRIPRIVLAILPLYLPILWVAYSSNRKMNLAKRLIEEYSHKEVLSKTFEGLSRQIDIVSDTDISADLRVKLLYNILEVNSENPGKLISDYNKSDHPLMDALEKSIKLTNAVTRLAKIPGFSKLASTLEKKSQEILIDETKKANAGLETLETK